MARYVHIPEHKEKARIAPIEVFPDPKVAIVLTCNIRRSQQTIVPSAIRSYRQKL
jgi:hypothetical protein